jgi:succinate dehydrogenase hydrophobic anchor subunit
MTDMTTRDWVWLLAEGATFIAVLLLTAWVCFKAVKGIKNIIDDWNT